MSRKRNNITTKVFFLLLINIMITSFISGLLYVSLGGKNIDINIPRENQIIRIVILLIGLVIQFIFSRIVVQTLLKPVIKFNDAIKKVAKGEFDTKLEDKTNSIEIYEIIESFNKMTKELAKTEMFRNDFVSNVSHEFKTPLATIDGYATLLQKDNISEYKKKIYIDKILKNTKKLSTLTGNILSLSNLENQNINIKKQVFSIDEQIREAILSYEREWDNKKIELDIELEEMLYKGNKEMLEQVWKNIIENSIKFVDYNGKIQVKSKRIYKNILVTISDNGIGMDEDTKKRIFEKFYQGDTSHYSEGNGLGLNIVKRIVDLHGGSIRVSSEIMNGSIFKVLLPIE